ncbi:phosphatidylserine decarboxylase [Melanogaster broomeanus]|nr:phosphatidylserine decarboxylase [Melanogaster broomeanus]
MSLVPKTKLSRYGGWLPPREIHKQFIAHHFKLAVIRQRADPHVPPVQAFADAINAVPLMRGLFDQIFLQVSPLNQVEDFDTLLHMLDGIVVQPPAYFIATYPDGSVIGEPIGVPIYLIFDLLSNTSAGYDLFRMEQFNAAMKALLVNWGTYLADPDQNPPAPYVPSNSSLTNETEPPERAGWFSTDALLSLESNLGGLSFEATYVCPDPGAVNRGFESWDAFFVRALQPGVRPVEVPDNPTLIHSACESTVYRISENVQLHDQFWLKDQKYSLYDMLDAALAQQLVDGTVYQAFLSPQDYHRWHSPVNGTVVAAFIIPGTYYAVIPDAGAEEGDPDLEPGDPHGALIRSQAFLTVSAARAVIFIQADDPIGLMCFIGVGMAEVSTCQLSVNNGDQVVIGQELGMFHFGGSSHALVFRPGIQVTWTDSVVLDRHQWVNSILGMANVRPVS